MGFLDGKRALIVGVASNRSIAWGIARAMRREGAELALTYQNERLRERVEEMAAELGCDIVLPCDVAQDAEIDALAAGLRAHWPELDILVHSIAYAPRELLEGSFLDSVTRTGFQIAHDISSYSLAGLTRALHGQMRVPGAAVLTLTYLGAQRAMPSYNIMGLAKASLEANVRYLAHCLGPQGIRVNAVSAGPIRTLAASGVRDLRKLMDEVAETAPLRRNVTIDEVGNVAAFLCSDLASAVTGEICYVDGGYNIVGAPAL